MHIPASRFFLLLLLGSVLLLPACKGKAKKPPHAEIVNKPEELKETATDHIRQSLDYATSNEGDIGDSTKLFNTAVLSSIYSKNEYAPFWSNSERFLPLADSMFRFIDSSRFYGLYPSDYHAPLLQQIRARILADTSGKTDRRDAALWSRADLMLSDAFLHIVKDIRWGRIPRDSISSKKDSVNDDFLQQEFNNLRKAGSVYRMIRPLEPKNAFYASIKEAIPSFLEGMDTNTYTFVPSPKNDSIRFPEFLQRRLAEGGYIKADSGQLDSSRLAAGIKKFQKEKGITVDGKAGETTLRLLNTSDNDRFARIAITLDKFKSLPDKMPSRYVWVNLPSFYMRLFDHDSIRLISKIVCGKPTTRTPLLTSSISEIITYPQWTVPASIIQKEILPAVKKNPGYLAKKGFSLVDKDGNEVDPFTVNWSKYTKGIPYKVVQGSGDANALGVLKFNFPNKYSVYLHDTNQRSFFALTSRSLSHGCVRVQEWEKLAQYIIRYDAGDSTQDVEMDIPALDSMNTWLARKEKHSIPIRNRLPLFIRYLTCDVKDNKLLFYDDIYGDDKRLQEAYFRGKK